MSDGPVDLANGAFLTDERERALVLLLFETGLRRTAATARERAGQHVRIVTFAPRSGPPRAPRLPRYRPTGRTVRLVEV